MAIALDTNTPLTNDGTTGPSSTLSHDGGSGSNRLTFVVCYSYDLNIAATCEYGGVPMTKVATVARGSAARNVHLFYLEDSPTGVNDAITSFTPNSRSIMGAVTFTGVDITDPIDDSYSTTTASAATSTTATLTATQAGDAGFGAIVVESGSEAANVAGTNATEVDEFDITMMFRSADVPISGSGSYNMTINHNSSRAGIIAVLLNPAAGGGPAPTNSAFLAFM